MIYFFSTCLCFSPCLSTPASLKISLTDTQHSLDKNTKETAELSISAMAERKRAEEQALSVAIEVVEADIAAAAVKVGLYMDYSLYFCCGLLIFLRNFDNRYPYI